MADYIEMDTQSLARDRQLIQKELEKMSTRMEYVKETMEHLGTMWEGPAHQAFFSQFAKDYLVMKQFEKEVQAFVQTMMYAEREYQKCEDAISQAVESIHL